VRRRIFVSVTQMSKKRATKRPAPNRSALDGARLKEDGTNMSNSESGPAKHNGGCICGDVRYEAAVNVAEASSCNCSVCMKLGVLGAFARPEAFKLLSDEAKLTSFSRRPEFANRFFCARCHVFCFGTGDLPELGGAFVSINLNTVDGFDPSLARIVHWDGRHDNWSAGTRPTPWPVSA
jgi:hypothetical protein